MVDWTILITTEETFNNISLYFVFEIQSDDRNTEECIALEPCKSVVVYFLLQDSIHVVIIFNLSDILITSGLYYINYTI